MCGATSDVRFEPIADMAFGRDGCRPSSRYGRNTGRSEQLVGFFTRELDRQNKLEQRPIFAIR
jgi:hypothetical protein